MRRIFLLSLVVVATFSFVACSKDGATGPAGPAGANGPAGPAGPAGAAGSAGAKGDSGTANVIYSDWLDIEYFPDTVRVAGKLDTVGYYSGINVAKITDAIVNGGDVRVYMNVYSPTGDLTIVYPLPYNAGSVSLSNIFYKGAIEFYSTDDFTTLQYSNGKKTYQFRYVIIPGGVKDGSKINWNNYTEVQKYLNMKN